MALVLLYFLSLQLSTYDNLQGKGAHCGSILKAHSPTSDRPHWLGHLRLEDNRVECTWRKDHMTSQQAGGDGWA